MTHIPTPLTRAFEDVCVMDAPLDRRLFAYNQKLKELNFPFAEAYDQLVARLYAGGIGSAAPQAGDAMPPFILPSKAGGLVSLEEILARGPAVISFNRGHWCPFCRIELRTIAGHSGQIAEHGGQLVSILPERKQFLDRLADETAGRFQLLCDIDNGYALSLGLALWLGDDLSRLMRGVGHHLERYQGNDGWFVPLPATFVVAPNGRIVARHVDPEFRTRMSIEGIISALAACRQ